MFVFNSCVMPFEYAFNVIVCSYVYVVCKISNLRLIYTYSDFMSSIAFRKSLRMSFFFFFHVFNIWMFRYIVGQNIVYVFLFFILFTFFFDFYFFFFFLLIWVVMFLCCSLWINFIFCFHCWAGLAEITYQWFLISVKMLYNEYSHRTSIFHAIRINRIKNKEMYLRWLWT